MLDLQHAQPELRPDDIAAEFGERTRFGRLILPTEGGSDGFYYARWVRR